MLIADNTERGLSLSKADPQAYDPFECEASFVAPDKIAKAKQVLSKLTTEVQQAILQLGKVSMLDKLNGAFESIYLHKTPLNSTSKDLLFTEQLTSGALGTYWPALLAIFFSLKEKMQVCDPDWSDLNIIRTPRGDIMLEYRGEYYFRENDYPFLSCIGRDALIKDNYIPAAAAEKFLQPLQKQQLEFLIYLSASAHMERIRDIRTARKHLTYAYRLYPNTGTFYELSDLCVNYNPDYQTIIDHASDILERFGSIDDALRSVRYDRAFAYLQLKDFLSAEKDYLSCLSIAQSKGDKDAEYRIYCLLLGIAKRLQDEGKATQYWNSLANIQIAYDSKKNQVLLAKNIFKGNFYNTPAYFGYIKFNTEADLARFLNTEP